ncbi:MAG: sulfotransferase domain-containing protein [Ktedonobacteraceae bacterium]
MKSSLDTTRSSDARSKGTTSSAQPASDAREINTSIPIPLPDKFYRGITNPIRLLPDFLVIGTQRGGTTSLFHYLEEHPYIQAAVNKDLHFFDRKYNKGLAWYRGHFPTRIEQYYAQRIRGHAFLTGEASPSYLFHPYAAKRVAQAIPHVKLIALLRNPVSRAYSQYHHAVELGHETLSFAEAIKDEEERTAREQEKIRQDPHYYSEEFKHRSYLTKGIYVDQLLMWMTLFPREQFLILKSEDFYADSAATFKKVLTFLNLPAVELEQEKQAYKQYNNNIYSSKMEPAMRKRLVEYFKPHNARLYEFLGVDFGWDK